MSEGQPAYRPQVESVEFAGARFDLVDLVDPARFRRGLRGEPGPVLRPNGVPAPLTEVSVLVSRGLVDGAEVVRFEGRISLAGPVRAARPVAEEGALHPAITGVAYVVPLVDALTRLAAGRVTTTIQDLESGLTVGLVRGRPKFDGSLTLVLAAAVPLADAGSDQLWAFVRTVFDVARREAGRPDDPDFFAGRVYTLSPHSAASSTVSSPSSSPSPSRIETTRLDQIGGLDDIVRQLREVADSFNHPEAMARWGARRPQGVLMSGPPGTGKTTLARALAGEISGTLKEIRTSDILDKWVGASERNIRRVFTQARRYRTPTVLLFDEFDSIISYTGAPQGSADQAINSVAGIFKQEMNTLIDENPNVIVVATTNFPERVDESLTRSGRFDLKLVVPLPDTGGRADILGKLLRHLISRHETPGFRMFADDLDVGELAVQTAGMSGADLKELLRRVQLSKAMQDARSPGAASAISQDDLIDGVTRMRLERSRGSRGR